ncbi:hypothetical protein KAFR_0G02890 [Kazachstania africana CBS 2517]|uniref:Tethering factor for nuclear proteasome STS1 n=1 Tax=Kazachstania africana (strain ATCC 22294 / BCRC 22015 / CBS 2517 / CECT 1963 / NBRC 1671 / NRRL Y-8276) TaxID=1071382 RepID=H2AY71_KAZAF|nr:hypothetical protein KAFR_0G02890 [Kazachstania africana CBS 2517]CCF59321.1 hypothetical protein KAFR_0G02890 [Kazachstania africana CBS 2517]
MTRNTTITAQDMGFSWGFSSIHENNNDNRTTDNIPTSSLSLMRSSDNSYDNESLYYNKSNSQTQDNNRQKRRLDLTNDDKNEEAQNISESTNNNHNNNNTRKYMVSKRKYNISTIIKGQELPIQRGIEFMEKQQLQNILLDLVKLNDPQITQFINSKISSSNLSYEKCLEHLKAKLTELFENIPYSKDFYNDMKNNKLDDYAFVRLKPYILEFLNCLIDFVLNNIPPIVNNLHESFNFVDNCTEMVLNLPRFQLPSNNYYYDKCLEQLSFIWCSLIEHAIKDTVITINDKSVLVEWMNKLHYYNELSNGMLNRPVVLFKSLDLSTTVGDLSNTATNADLLSSVANNRNR